MKRTASWIELWTSLTLPHLNDNEVQEGVHTATIKRENTLTQLHEFDANKIESELCWSNNYRILIIANELNSPLKRNLDARIEELNVNVIRTGINRTKPGGIMLKSCPHCMCLLDGFEVISEVPKVGR